VASTLDAFPGGAVGFIDWLDPSFGPAPPHAKRNDQVARRVAGEACAKWTGKHTPAGDRTIHGILDDNAECIGRNECDEPHPTERDIWYDKAKKYKPDGRRYCVSNEKRDYNKPPSCNAKLKREEHNKLARERDYPNPRRKSADRIRREKSWKDDVRENEVHDLTRTR
jgi:hypothetical protein